MKGALKTTLLVFAAFVAFVLVGAIYGMIVSLDSNVNEPENTGTTSTFEGPSTPPGLKGPSGPPPGS